jgi:hypothetical protein
MSAARAAVALVLLCAALSTGRDAGAQPPAGPRPPPASPREAAPIDLTGQWVAVVNEDWRWRMVTPPKGDYASVPLNDEGRRVADQWEPSQDGACEAYGAAALLRMPTRLRIRWDGNERLVLETDAGRQVRNLDFGTMPAAAEARSLQGRSAAKWVTPPRPGGGPGLAGAGGGGPARMGGYLEVRTTNLTPGWLRRNGVPYSEDAVVTEYFARFGAPNGDEWLMVTTIVDDPRYLTQRYIVSNHFRKEPEGGRWNPRACGAAS